MANEVKIDEFSRAVQRRLGLLTYPAILGDANGIVDEPGKPGYGRVRYTTAEGFSLSPVVRMRAILPPQPGLAVIVGYDKQDELAVLEGDFSGMLQQGTNPLIANPAHPAVYGFTNQSSIVTALSFALSTPNTPSTDVGVKRWIRLQDDIWHDFPGEGVSLGGSIPGAGLQRLAGLYLKTDLTIEVLTSTSKALLDPLGIDDVQEIHDARTDGSIPIWFWRLYGGQTDIKDGDSYLDARQFINSVTSSGGSGTADDIAPLVLSGW